jgi:cell shape-determining protein MreC
MQLSSGEILTGLYIVIGIMLIVVLYHVLFIVVDLRKVLRRIEDITAQVESVILKPISMADQILEWVVDHIESWKEEKGKKSKHKGR